MINLFFKILLSFFLVVNSLLADQIIKDKNGNFFLIKEDGSYEKLPPPKPGNKYVIKKIIKQKPEKKKIFKKTEKKARIRSNTGFR